MISVCKGYARLKPFTDEARIDLGIALTFNGCEHYISIDDENSEENITDED